MRTNSTPSALRLAKFFTDEWIRQGKTYTPGILSLLRNIKTENLTDESVEFLSFQEDRNYDTCCPVDHLVTVLWMFINCEIEEARPSFFTEFMRTIPKVCLALGIPSDSVKDHIELDEYMTTQMELMAESCLASVAN